jgi:rsbT co-antagonist protein RsbR
MTARKTFGPELGLEGAKLEAQAGGLSIGGVRALLYSHVAIEMLRRQLFHQVGDELARAILAQAGRSAGFNDAQLILQERHFEHFHEMLEAQFALLAGSGFGRFEILELVASRGSREIYGRVRCFGSPEAESHRRLFGTSESASCCHLVGYSTGWASSMTGTQLLTVETHCSSKGDDYCEFETMPYAEFVGPIANFWKKTFESTSSSLAQELQEKLATIEQQMATISLQREDIARLSSPIMQVGEKVLVLPVIGSVSSERATIMEEALLREIVRRRAFGVIVDLTGVGAMDSGSATHILRMLRSVRLLGSQAVLTGISPALSQLLVAEDVDISESPTRRTLHEGLRYLERNLNEGRSR